MSIAEPPRSGSDLERSAPRPGARREMPRATIDIRLPWPLGRTMLVVALLVGLCFGVATSMLGARTYHGELQLLVLKLNDPNPSQGVEIVDRRITAIAAIARSENFLVELQRETGVDLDPRRARRHGRGHPPQLRRHRRSSRSPARTRRW